MCAPKRVSKTAMALLLFVAPVPSSGFETKISESSDPSVSVPLFLLLRLSAFGFYTFALFFAHFGIDGDMDKRLRQRYSAFRKVGTACLVTLYVMFGVLVYIVVFAVRTPGKHPRQHDND